MTTILATGIASTLSVLQPVIADENDQGDDFVWENVDNPTANTDTQGNDIGSSNDDADSGGDSADDIASGAEDDDDVGVPILPDIDENNDDQGGDGAGSVAGP